MSEPTRPVRQLAIFWSPVASSDVASLLGTLRHRIDVVEAENSDVALNLAKLEAARLACFVATGSEADSTSLLTQVKMQCGDQCYTVLFNRGVSIDPEARLRAADEGVDMVTHIRNDFLLAVERTTMMPVLAERLLDPTVFKYDCPLCPLKNLDSLSLWHHMPLFHTP